MLRKTVQVTCYQFTGASFYYNIETTLLITTVTLSSLLPRGSESKDATPLFQDWGD